jgi:hypothetical protein
METLFDDEASKLAAAMRCRANPGQSATAADKARGWLEQRHHKLLAMSDIAAETLRAALRNYRPCGFRLR